MTLAVTLADPGSMVPAPITTPVALPYNLDGIRAAMFDFDLYAMADVVSDLYKDPANVFVDFGQMLPVARDKLKGQLEELRSPVLKAEKRIEKLKKFSSLFSPEIQQVVISELDAVDRCQTCHAFSDKVGFEKDDYGITGAANKGKPMPEPYRTHPLRKELISKHPIDRFGCTSCHQGQGRALAVDVAHSVVTHTKNGLSWTEPKEYWEEPTLNVKDGSVQPVLTQWTLPSQEIHAVYPSPRLVPTKVTGLIAWLRGHFDDEWWAR